MVVAFALLHGLLPLQLDTPDGAIQGSGLLPPALGLHSLAADPWFTFAPVTSFASVSPELAWCDGALSASLTRLSHLVRAAYDPEAPHPQGHCPTLLFPYPCSHSAAVLGTLRWPELSVVDTLRPASLILLVHTHGLLWATSFPGAGVDRCEHMLAVEFGRPMPM